MSKANTSYLIIVLGVQGHRLHARFLGSKCRTNVEELRVESQCTYRKQTGSIRSHPTLLPFCASNSIFIHSLQDSRPTHYILLPCNSSTVATWVNNTKSQVLRTTRGLPTATCQDTDYTLYNPQNTCSHGPGQNRKLEKG
jgi:hypothetical protein